MKVLSWNMLFTNSHLERALAFLRSADADIICLQEVPKQFLLQLRALPYELVSAQEIERVHRSGRSAQYLVILSRYPIRRRQAVRLPLRDTHDPLRTRLFVRVMRALGVWAQGVGDRHALIADLDTHDGIVRAFNLHLPLHRFAWRQEEFELALAERDATIPTIVCGDFNTLESRRIAVLSWLLGGRFASAVRWRRERTNMQERFDAHGLTNPLRGRITHPLSNSQLDHILASKHFFVGESAAQRETIGSDHRPIFAVLSRFPIAQTNDNHEDRGRSERYELIQRR